MEAYCPKMPIQKGAFFEQTISVSAAVELRRGGIVVWMAVGKGNRCCRG